MSDFLTSIEKAAAKLDERRQSRLRDTSVDFEAYMKARDEDIGKVKDAKSFREDLHEEFFGEEEMRGLHLPWREAGHDFRIRPGEVTLWAGYNGHMKSMVTGYVMMHLLHQGQKACIASFEMKPRKTLRRMATQAVGTRSPSAKYIDKFLDMLTGKLWLYDQQGEVSVERLMGVIYYCAEQLGVTQFVIDSMMKVVADEDDYNGQKKFMGKLCAAAKDLNIHIHLVLHARKGVDENKRPGKQDIKGSGSIVDQTDNCVVVFKTPKKPTDDDSKPDFVLYFDKQRHGEWEGYAPLWFDEASLQFKESPRDRSQCWVDEAEEEYV